jgi:hypothetical protein
MIEYALLLFTSNLIESIFRYTSFNWNLYPLAAKACSKYSRVELPFSRMINGCSDRSFREIEDLLQNSLCSL